MRKKIGIAAWWLGTGTAFVAFCVSFYWLFSISSDSVDLAIISIYYIPLVTGPLWAISYLLAGPFWNETK